MKKLICHVIVLLLVRHSFAQNPGDTIFSSQQVHTIKLYFNQSHWWDSLMANYPLDKKMLASMEIDGIWFDSVGAQLKGNSSFNNPGQKKSFKVDMNEYVDGQELEGLKKFNLNNGFKDPTFLREKITLDFCRNHGIVAPRCTYANLYLNDTLWGLYTFIEQIDKTFLGTNFSDNDGNLFKGDPMGSLQWYGPMDSSYYHRYELKTNDSLNDWSDLVHLLDKINNTAPQNFYDSLETILSTSSFIKYWAMNILFANLDSYNGSGHNYYVYHDPDFDRFYFIAWDVNEAFGCFTQGMSVTQLENLNINYQPNGRPLVQKMLANQSYFNLYKLTLCDYILQDFNSTFLDPIIDSIANVIRPSVYADTKKFYTNQQFEDNRTINTGGAPALKPFISNRHASISSQLASLCFTTSVEIENKNTLLIYPNPATDHITVLAGASLINGITMYNSIGETVYVSTKSDVNPTVIDVSYFPKGIYFITVATDREQHSGKIVIEGKE